MEQCRYDGFSQGDAYSLQLLFDKVFLKLFALSIQVLLFRGGMVKSNGCSDAIVSTFNKLYSGW